MWVKNQYGNAVNLKQVVGISKDGGEPVLPGRVTITAYTTEPAIEDMDNRWAICTVKDEVTAKKVIDGILQLTTLLPKGSVIDMQVVAEQWGIELCE
jgi:hypothetical protein